MKTLEETRRQGFDALRKCLGRADTIRFLQQFETGKGDYTEQRRTWVDSTTLEELKDSIHQNRSAKKRRKK